MSLTLGDIVNEARLLIDEDFAHVNVWVIDRAGNQYRIDTAETDATGNVVLRLTDSRGNEQEEPSFDFVNLIKPTNLEVK